MKIPKIFHFSIIIECKANNTNTEAWNWKKNQNTYLFWFGYVLVSFFLRIIGVLYILDFP